MFFLQTLTKGDSFLSSYLKGKSEIITTFITNEYTDMALNWYKWVEKADLNSNALICCLDEKAYNRVLESHLPCIYIDEQETHKNYNTDSGTDFYKLPRHICIMLAVQYITKKYNIDIIYTDADMIILKNVFKKIKDELNKGVDSLLYTNKTYNELTTGVKYGEASRDGGGILVYWSSTNIDKFFKKIQNNLGVNADSPRETSIGSFSKLFDFNITSLNSFEFTNIDMWRNDHLRKILKKISYIVHYNMFDDVTKLNREQIINMINKKIESMKCYDHWLL